MYMFSSCFNHLDIPVLPSGEDLGGLLVDPRKVYGLHTVFNEKTPIILSHSGPRLGSHPNSRARLLAR